MSSFLAGLFGRKPPAASAARTELDRVEAALADASARGAAAEAQLARVADLTDAQHAAAEAGLAVARREAIRFSAQAEQLRAALAAAEAAEAAAAAAAALVAHVEAARKRMAGYKKAVALYDERAEVLADAIADVVAIEEEVDAANRAIDAAKKAGLDTPERIATAEELYRTTPDVVEPDRTIQEEGWYINTAQDRFVEGGQERWRPAAGVYRVINGETRPEDFGAVKRTTTRTIPGKVRKGWRCAAPFAGFFLPGGGLGAGQHWPRAPK